ncbi:MAG: alpha/beta hydrolase [Phycisphaerales bacterium]|nr:alpha/beta hydrolase [Phycisphaerales bacterium]
MAMASMSSAAECIAGAVKTHTTTAWLQCVRSVVAISAITVLAGCATTPTDIPARCERGYVYYLDGAGGGRPLSNWASGVRDGLRTAGYPGWGEMFTWQTGLGVAPDQLASNEYKRAKAAQLARKIVAFQQTHPNTPITLVGHSAGTAIAVFALEALPERPIIENVILLSGSLSADYDLTVALMRVRQNMYVFTSDRDVILTVLLPISGPADRGAASNHVTGVSGAILPANPRPETAHQYSKVVEVQWNPSFRSIGHVGGHLDALSEPFVRAFVAPLVFAAPTSQADGYPPQGTVRNPDYQCWAAFPPGSWALLEGTCTRDGRTDVCRVKTTLISKTVDSAIIKHDLTINGQRPVEIQITQRSIVMANIDPQDHPITHPAADVARVRQVEIPIVGERTKCDVTRIAVPGEFDFWGDNIRAEICTASNVPGYLVRLDLRTVLDGKRYEFALRLKSLSVASSPVHF